MRFNIIINNHSNPNLPQSLTSLRQKNITYVMFHKTWIYISTTQTVDEVAYKECSIRN